MRRLGLWVALGLAGSALAAGAPVGVCVTAAAVKERKKVDDATKRALKARKEKARDARKTLEKELRQKYGKKREGWPPAKDAQLTALEETEARASADFEYIKVDPKALRDSVEDITKELDGLVRQRRLSLASSEKEADLVLRVEGRRGEKTLPTYFKPDRCYLLFSLGPGGKPGAAKRFARVPAAWRPRKVRAFKVQAPRAGSPSFLFESDNGLGTEVGCYSSAADAAAKTLDRLLSDNPAVFAAK